MLFPRQSTDTIRNTPSMDAVEGGRWAATEDMAKRERRERKGKQVYKTGAMGLQRSQRDRNT